MKRLEKRAVVASDVGATFSYNGNCSAWKVVGGWLLVVHFVICVKSDSKERGRWFVVVCSTMVYAKTRIHNSNSLSTNHVFLTLTSLLTTPSCMYPPRMNFHFKVAHLIFGMVQCVRYIYVRTIPRRPLINNMFSWCLLSSCVTFCSQLTLIKVKIWTENILVGISDWI